MTIRVDTPLGGFTIPLGGLGGMGGGPRVLDLDPVFPVVRRALVQMDLLTPLKSFVDGLDSGPLVNVSLVSLKSTPYVYHRENRVVSHFDNGISCRMRYLEAAVMSTASLVYNVVFGVIFSVVSLMTLGQVKEVMGQMRKHWTHTALAAASTAIAAVGTVSPEFGIKANAACLLAGGLAVIQIAQGSAIQRLTDAYQRNAQSFKDAVLAGLGGDRGYFNQHFVPFFNHLDQNFGPGVHSLVDMIQVAQTAINLLPDVIPNATAATIRGNLESVVADWGREIGAASSSG